ncbi:MAG: PLP-dependent transferase [Pirellulaceae bacterium]|nr:PLP-dependent transferase [Pirellulaceae bacterium]
MISLLGRLSKSLLAYEAFKGTLVVEHGEFPSLDDVCLSNPPAPTLSTHPSSPAIFLAATYACSDPDQANRILGGDEFGFAYQRDAHPNGLRLAEKFRLLHHADQALVTNSGMAALSAIVLHQLRAGDHCLISRYLYGRSSVLIQQELPKFGIESTEFDPTDLESVRRNVRRGQTKLLLVETIANPLLQVADLPGLVALGREYGFQVAVDNTFATPYWCRPLELGVDWVWESVSKMLNGHSDLMMGMVCGKDEHWGRIRQMASTWGLGAAPWDCFLAERGLTTFGLRIERASQNAGLAARYLVEHNDVKQVFYPGLPHHPTQANLKSIANTKAASDSPNDVAGNVVSFELDLQQRSVEQFIATSGILYFPSLGECSTTLSHPCSSSHRHLSENQQRALGISPGTIRLSFGIEAFDTLREKIRAGLGVSQLTTQK